MAHDVFISYSSKDQLIAEAFCHYLEERKIRCWIAKRNVTPGEYAESIERAVAQCRVCVILFSVHSASSQHCVREIDLAVKYEKIIIPFRIEDQQPQGSMAYYLGNCHWIDAFPQPEALFHSAATAIADLLKMPVSAAASTPIPVFEKEKMGPASSSPKEKNWPGKIFTVIRYWGTGVAALVCPVLLTVAVCLSLAGKIVPFGMKVTIAIWAPLSLLGAYFLRYDNLQGLAEIREMIRHSEIKNMLGGYIRILFCALLIVVSGSGLLAYGIILVMQIINRPEMSLAQFGVNLLWFFSFFFPCIALFETGRAVLREDYQKFYFTPRRVKKWLLRLFLSLGVLVIGGIVSAHCGITYDFNTKTPAKAVQKNRK